VVYISTTKYRHYAVHAKILNKSQLRLLSIMNFNAQV